MNFTTPAVVVRGELNGLGVVRSLASGGVPSIVVDTTRRRAATWSRYCRTHLVDRLHGRGFIDDLLALQRAIGARPVLLLTDEMAVNTVSEHREELARAYRFRLPSPDMVTILGNKARFQELAQQHGLPVPRTFILSRDSDLAQLADLDLPIILKPADKAPVYLGETQRLHVLEDLDNAVALCRDLLPKAGELVAQEWVDGSDTDIYFSLFYRGGDSDRVAMFSGRKLVCHPPDFGTTAMCVAAPDVAPLLEPLTLDFIGLCQYRGLGSLEFKWDIRRKRFVIIEPTVGRTDWQEEVATLNGVNIPLAAYRDLMGLPHIAPAPGEHAAAWRESFAYWRGGSALPPDVRVHDGYWRLADPMPALVFYGNAILDRFRQRVMRPMRDGGRAGRRRSMSAAKQI